MGQLDLMQATKRGHRLLGRTIRIAHGVGDLVQLLFERIIDEPLFGAQPRTSARYSLCT